MKILFVFVYFVSFLTNSVKGTSIEALEQVADAAARSAYARINQNWRYPESIETPVSTTPSWEVVSVSIGSGSTSIVRWISEKSPHLVDALEEIFDAQGLLMECSNAARLVRLYMICQMLGKEQTMSLSTRVRAQHPGSHFNFMNALSWSFLEKSENLEAPGVYCFPFVNIEMYADFKPDGAARNHNVVGLLDKTYLGFEPDFFSAPQKHEDVERLLYECFCKREDVLPVKKKEHKNYVKKLTFKAFQGMRRDHQERAGFYKFNMTKIQSFIMKKGSV